METVTMPWSVGIRFAHASLQVLAQDHGIDLLHIKGPAVDDSLLEVRRGGEPGPEGEPPGSDARAGRLVARRSIDADVLVHPSQADRLFAVMHEHRWETRFRFEDGSAFEHAATLVHPVLAPVDVHRCFPGIDADPAAAFDRLWADRHVVDIAGQPCAVPSVAAQRLILIVHAARAGRLGHPDIRRSWTDATEAERDEVRRLADDLSAAVALAAGTGHLADHRGARSYQLWRALSSGERSRVRMWVARVRAAPTRRAALRTAVHLVVPNQHRMATFLGRPPTTNEVARAYLQRARWGSRELGRLAAAGLRRSKGRR